MTGWMKRMKRLAGRIGTALLAVILIVETTGVANAASYMQPYLNKVVEWGIMRGDLEGNLNEDTNISRAEFSTMVNRAFGYEKTGPTPFRDVPENAWYAEDVGIAYNVGYIAGTSATTFSPDENVTREQASLILARILMLQPQVGENTMFTDSRSMENWSRGYIASVAQQGLITGYPDGRFGPKDNLTRGQAAIILTNALGTPLMEAGDYALGSVWGNVTITQSGTTLRNTVVGGDLYITEGVDLGHVTLENVTVLGRIVVCGGGTSEDGEDSIILRNVTAPELLVDNLDNHLLSLKVEGDGKIDQAYVRTSAYLADNTADGCGIAKITMDGERNEALTLSGNVKEVINKAPSTTVSLASGQADTITVDESAVDSTLNIAAGSRVDNVNLDTGTDVIGGGDIGKLTVNSDGSTVTMLPDQIVIRPGNTANINGETMDSAAAAESSADPRLYAGYPKMKDLAPTSGTAVFSANKKGTVYWALTAVTDGSVTADELVNPSGYNPKVIKSGTVSLTGSGKEGTSKISGLTSDGSYYLSAVFVDARDSRSPLKVISFTTPDNTKPDFASGYPYLSRITKNSAQVTTMATKSCRLYWAVLPKGASAPTASDFKANSISGNLGFGSTDVIKNTAYSFDVNNVPLEELESYDLYLWLVDVDNGQSSAVKKLSFTTVDGTPPVFNTEPTINKVDKTSVGLYANLNEAGTLYWVVVEHGTTYPKPLAGQSGEVDWTSDTAKLQVSAGMNALKSGKVSMTEGKDVNFNVSGLETEKSYDLYYVAQDKAGNYTASIGMIEIHTLDSNAPTVTQEFTKYNGTDTTRPLPDSDVRLVFSESVQTNDTYTPLVDLYKDVTDAANTGAAEDNARQKMAAALSKAIYLYQVSSDGQENKLEGYTGSDKNTDDWTIDYRYAVITIEEGKTVVTFPSGEGINLKSGASYYFEIQADSIADTSSAVNVMGRERLDKFTTVFAIVNLTARNENTIETYVDQAGTEHDLDAEDAIPVDLSWRLSPVSTDKVDDSIDWDMLIWSDTSVTLQLFYREIGSSATTWKLLGEREIPVPDDTNGYLGVSLTRHFLQNTNNPDFDQLNILKEGTNYEYAISFTKVAGLSDRSTWSQRLNMKVNVVAGSNNDLSFLSGEVTEDNWDEALKTGVTNIGQPADFSMRKQFTDNVAPTFAGEYPKLDAGDSAVNMSLMLDRPGTVYYVVAPLGYVGTTDNQDNIYNNTETGIDNWENLPDSGLKDDINNPDNPNPVILTQPDYLNIVNAGSNYRNEKIKYGSVACGSSVETKLVEGLDKQTRYIAYFVLQGTSQTYSRVLAYRFETTDVAKPKLTLTDFSPSVNFKTDSSADVNYALVASNEIPGSLESDFGLVVDPAKKTEWEDYEDTLSTTTDTSVLWALLTTYKTGYTVFDEFAGEGIRNTVDEFVRGVTSMGVDVATRGSTALTQANSYSKEQNFTANMRGATYYYCLATAVSPLGSELSFAAVAGIHIRDSEPPKLLQVNTAASPDAGGKTYSGTVTFVFDEPVYQLVTQNGVDQEPKEVWQYIGTPDDDAVLLLEIIGTSAGKNSFYYTNYNKNPASTLTLGFNGIPLGTTIVLFDSSFICDANSNSTRERLSFVLQEGSIGVVQGGVSFVRQK